MTYLPDVNVWIALTSNRHVHHVSAKRWLDSVANEEIAFCRISELGFLRLLTNRHVMQVDVLSPVEAWRAYDSFRADSRILFLPESSGFSERWRQAEAEVSNGPNAWTDAYLAVFAKHVNAAVVTFDRGFKAVGGCSITLIP
jgi:hypothetical protein